MLVLHIMWVDCICVNCEKESEVKATELKEGERQCRTEMTERTEKRKDTCAHEHHTRKAEIRERYNRGAYILAL